jgi:hypothetical protein
MPKLISATCNKTVPVGARCVKNAFPKDSHRKGYFVAGKGPLVKHTSGKAEGCVRAARPAESKRIRQAHRVMIKSVKKTLSKKGTKKVMSKKASSKTKSGKKAKTIKLDTLGQRRGSSKA